MDSSSNYGSWTMQTNNQPDLVWQFGANGVSQPSASPSSIPTTSHPEYLDLQPQMMQQPPQAYQNQQPRHNYQPQAYPQSYAADPAQSGMAASSDIAANSLSESTFYQLQAAYADASPGLLINAIFPRTQNQQDHHQQQAMMQQYQPQSHGLEPLTQSAPQMQPPTSYAQAHARHELFRPHPDSDNSLAQALTFTLPQALPPNASLSSAISLAQQSMPSASTSDGALNVAASSNASERKPTKLRQSKLTFLPGVSQSVVKETPPVPAQATNAPTASSAAAGATVVVDSGSEPGTPPLPRAKALAAAKPSTTGTAKSVAAGKSISPSAPSEAIKISDKARRYLARLNVEQKPKATARQLVELLSDLGASGKFLKPRPTNAEDRKIIVETLNSIAKLETGKGYTESGRKRFFEALMDLPAARHILSAWLKATVPPKKVTEATPDHSRRYKDTLLPLLNILGTVDMKSYYLTDDAAIGKSISGVVNRAVDPSARALASNIKDKWSKMIADEGAKGAAPARSASTMSAAASSSTAAAACAKRKPAESAAAAESVKRYKTASASPTTASVSGRAAKPAAAPSSANAKPGLPFFGAGSARRPTSTATSSNAGSSSGSRMIAHQNIMSLVDRYSGGAGNDRTAASQVIAPSAEAAAAKTKVKKRVTWKPDDELVAIKLIEPADYGRGDDEQEHVESAGDVHDEGLALRQSVSTMEALMDCREPREVMATMCDAGPIGSESVEGPFQTQRSAGREERVDADEEEPSSPDESHLEQPGAISEAPAELVGVESVEIPTPWMGEGVDADADADVMDVKEEVNDMCATTDLVPAVPATTSTGIPSTANLSELLSKVAQSVGAGANTGATTSNWAGSAAALPSAAALNIDANQLRSIVDAAAGSGSPSTAANANAAIAAAGFNNANLSSLLSNLSRSSAPQPVPRSMEAAEQPSYWQQQTYRGGGVGSGTNYVPQQESYPGEYQQDYQPPAPQYGRSAHSYDYDAYTPGVSRDGGASGWGGGGGRASKQFTTPCKFFAQGACRNGDRCTFRH